MALSESELCLSCDEGGALSVCSGNDCPIAVHEKCKFSFDENGLFCCPYCLYKKAVAEKSRAWNNLRFKSQALTIFFKRVEERQGAEGKSPIENGTKTICRGSKGDDALISESQNCRLIVGSKGDKEDAHVKDATEVQETTIPSRKRLDNTESKEKLAQENSESDTDGLPLIVRANSIAKKGVKKKHSTCRDSGVIPMQNKRVKQNDMNELPSSSPSKGPNASRLDNQNDLSGGSSEGDEEEAQMEDSTEVQERITQLKMKPDNTERKWCRIESGEEEKMQKRVHKVSASPSGEVPLAQPHSTANRGVEKDNSRSRDSLMQSKRVKRSDMDRVQSPSPSKCAEFSRLDSQNDVSNGSFEGDEEDSRMKDSTELQETITPSRRKPDNMERQGRGIGGGEEEKMQKRVHKIPATATGEVPLGQAHPTAKRGVKKDNTRCRVSEDISMKSKLVKRSEMNGVQSPSPSKGAGASRLHNENVMSGSSGGDEEHAQMKDSTEVQERVTPSRRKLDNTERQGLRIDRVEEAKMQERVQKVSASPTEVPIARAHSTAKRGLKYDNSRCRDSELISTKMKLVKRNDMNRVQSPSPSKGAGSSRLDNQNDVASGSSESDKEDSHMKDSIEVQETVTPSRRKPDKAARQGCRIGNAEKGKMQEGVQEISAAPSPTGEDPLVQAHSTAKRGVERNNSRCRDSDVISVQSKRVKRSDMNGVQASSTSKEADDSRLDSENDVVSASPESDKEDSNVKDSTETQEEIPSRRKPDCIKMQEEQRISTEEEDEIQETSASTSEDSLVQAHLGSKRGMKTDKSVPREYDVISKRKKDFKRGEKKRTESPTFDSPMISPLRSSSDLGFKTVKKGNDASSSSRLLEQRSAKFPKDAFGKERRNKLLWRKEEEKMLEEGIEKFSQPGKNIPWKKVLEYGHKVFHDTRTPVDLKDKWKNMTK